MTALLTAQEVAGLFRVEPRTVWAWVRDGRIEAIRTPGNRLRFTHEAVQAARDRGPDGNDDGHDAPQGAAHPLPAPPPAAGACGYPIPELYRQDDGWCYCGAPYARH